MPQPAARGPDWFDRILKVELHCHLEGTVRPATVIELARKAGRPLWVELDVLGAERIDHGVAITDDPALLCRAAAHEGVPLTISPRAMS
jgi:adenosine deaminase